MNNNLVFTGDEYEDMNPRNKKQLGLAYADAIGGAFLTYHKALQAVLHNHPMVNHFLHKTAGVLHDVIAHHTTNSPEELGQLMIDKIKKNGIFKKIPESKDLGTHVANVYNKVKEMHGGDIPIHHLVGALKDVANANCPESKASLLYNDAKMGGGYSPILCAMHLAGSLVPEVHDITTGGSFWNSFAKGFKKGFGTVMNIGAPIASVIAPEAAPFLGAATAAVNAIPS